MHCAYPLVELLLRRRSSLPHSFSLSGTQLREKTMGNLWDQEPAVYVAVITAALTLLVAFGFDLTVEQTGAIVAFVQVVAGFLTRSQVSPV